MKLSTDALNMLGSGEGVTLNNQLIMGNAGGDRADFLTAGFLFMGGFNTPQVGLYLSPIINPSPVLLPPSQQPPLSMTALWTDGQSQWLGNFTDGARDSRGNVWSTRAAIGASRQGDWIFVNKTTLVVGSTTYAPFTAVIVHYATGAEAIYAGSPIAAYMDKGVLLYGVPGASVMAQGAWTPLIPGVMSFATMLDGTRQLAGYAAGGKLCVANWADTPNGYVLSQDGQDFNPVCACRPSDGLLIVATGQNAGETVQRYYVVDLPNTRYTLNGGPWTPLQPINLLTGGSTPLPPIEPPVEPPVPPQPPIPPLPPTGDDMRSDLKIEALTPLSTLTEVPHPAGQNLVGLKTSSGLYKSFTPDGVWQADSANLGPWEAFLPYGGVYLAQRNGGTGLPYTVGTRLPDVIPAP